MQGNGQVDEAGGRLRQATLTASDWTQFAEGIHTLACKREKTPGGFDKFVQIVKKRNFTIFIDAANVAFFNTRWLEEGDNPHSRFQWLQVQAVYEAVKKKYPGQEILVVVSGMRISRSCVHSDAEQQFLDQLKVCWNTLCCKCSVWGKCSEQVVPCLRRLHNKAPVCTCMYQKTGTVWVVRAAFQN